MSGSLRILHITHDGRPAGSSVSIALLARAQHRAGHHVTVVCPPGYLAERIEADGVMWRQADVGSGISTDVTLRRLVENNDIDVVNSHSSKDRAITRHMRITGRLRAALVMTRRAMPRSSLPSAVFSGWAADRVIAVSRAVADALIRRGTPRSRISVVHNAVDLERLDRPYPPVGAPFMGAPVVGVVSRRKDHETLLRAMALLTTPATLVSIGFEPDRKLQSLASVLGPRSSVIFLPFQDPRAFYDRFDIVVLPTLEEGFSQGLMEAMALGKAVVTTRVRSNEELIEHGVTGLLVPPRDAPAMAGAIGRLLADRALADRLGAAARAHVRSSFTIERTMEKTGEAYRDALLRRMR